MSSTTAPPRTRGSAPRRSRGSATAASRSEAQPTGLSDALQELKRRGESAATALRRDLDLVRTLIGDELRYYRENQPPLLNPLPFPL